MYNIILQIKSYINSKFNKKENNILLTPYECYIITDIQKNNTQHTDIIQSDYKLIKPFK